MEQLQLFEMTETDRLSQKIQGCIASTDNLRRGMFSRHDALYKMYNEMKDEMDEMRLEIDRLKIRISAMDQEIPKESKRMVFHF